MARPVTDLPRHPDAASSEPYDLIIVGGGIHGAMLLLEAGRRRLRALLLERQDFGAGTSYHSLRIIHGGFRYLQSMNLRRFRESVRERRWFLRQYPELVSPLPCMMPLGRHGLKRPAVLRVALWANDLLSADRNAGLAAPRTIPPGAIVGPAAAERILPGLRDPRLAGAAVWHDAAMADPQRVLIETLRRACALGGRALNHVRVDGLLTGRQRVQGVRATDHVSRTELEFRAPVVVNAAGPGCRALAASWDRDIPALFRPSLAWNVLFDMPAPSTHALALTPAHPGARTYFLTPWKGRLLAGTGHAPWRGDPVRPWVDDGLLDRFLADLNSVLPGAPLDAERIVRIHAGFMPVTRAGSVDLCARETLIDHGRRGGPAGLFSVSGVKYTTARRVAERTLAMACPGARRAGGTEPAPPVRTGIAAGLPWAWRPQDGPRGWREELARIIEQEAVVHLDDLILRRTGIGDDPRRARALAPDIAALFDWSDSRRRQEIARITTEPASGRS